MTEQQLRMVLRANGVEEDELEAQLDRWIDEQQHDQEERHYIERVERKEKPE
jgi:hypothetical protein